MRLLIAAMVPSREEAARIVAEQLEILYGINRFDAYYWLLENPQGVGELDRIVLRFVEHMAMTGGLN